MSLLGRQILTESTRIGGASGLVDGQLLLQLGDLLISDAQVDHLGTRLLGKLRQLVLHAVDGNSLAGGVLLGGYLWLIRHVLLPLCDEKRVTIR